MAAEFWYRRIHQRPLIPILALLTVVVTFGWLNSDVLSPYAKPRLFGDSKGAVALYDLALFDEAKRGAFVFREKVGERWSSPKKAVGKVNDGALGEDKLYLLFPKVLSSYDRDTRKRLSNADITTLPFLPTALAQSPLGKGEESTTNLSLFGFDKFQNLCVAVYENGQVRALGDKVAEASGLLAADIVQPKNSFSWFNESEHVEELRPIKSKVKVSVRAKTLAYQSLVLIGTPKTEYDLAEKRRKSVAEAKKNEKPVPSAEPITARVGSLNLSEKRSVYRWVLFDHNTSKFGQVVDFPEPALAATVSADSQGFHIFAVRSAKSNEIEHWQWHPSNSEQAAFERVGLIPYTRSGFVNRFGASDLSAAQVQGETLLLAQFGGSIQLLNLGTTVKAGKTSRWFVLARLPNEAQTIIFGWFFLVLLLLGLLILLGLHRLRQRRVDWPEMPTARLDDEIRTIVELGHREAQMRQPNATATQTQEAGNPERKTSESSRENKIDGSTESPNSSPSE